MTARIIDDQPLIGISVSESPDLHERGFAEEHLTELMLNIARLVLSLRTPVPTGLVFGGDLRSGGFTRTLYEIALSADQTGSRDARSASGPPRRIYNYLAWPYYLTLGKQDEAQMINACHFMRIRPEDAGFKVAVARLVDKMPDALLASRCLTRMRELSTWGGHPSPEGQVVPQPLRARVMLGGKTTGYSSFMPGLFEEFLVSREPPSAEFAPVPVFIVGGYGGAAAQVARALLDPGQREPMSRPYQEKLFADAVSESKRASLPDLLRSFADHPDLPQPDQRYAALLQAIDTLSMAIRADDGEALDNGLTPSENRRLLRSSDELEIRQLIRKGLGDICAIDLVDK